MAAVNWSEIDRFIEKELTLAEISEYKSQLESRIAHLLRVFEYNTGLEIETVSINQTNNPTLVRQVVSNIKIEVKKVL